MKKIYGWQRYQPQAALSLLLLAAPGLVPHQALATTVLSPVQWQLTGKVVSEKGEGLPGVTVALKGTTIGVSTGVDGSFTLSVPETGGTLVFSYVGFQSVERSFTGETTLSVTLKEDTKALEEVLVVGYGTQKKADVTGAIATLDATKLEERPIIRVDQALIGQLAGVQVQQNTGLPGRGFNVQVRGNGSITANNQPLYVIDGFPLEATSPNGNGNYNTGSPLDNINPNDIERIEVLKDAAAAAIYGSRAANGVVLVTTKRGKTGKPQINFNTYAGVSMMAKKLDLLSAEEWVERATEIINTNWVKSGPNRTAGQTNEQRRQILGLAPGTVNTSLMTDDRWFEPGHPGLAYIDWQDEIFRTGKVQNYQVSASGATNNVNYYVSGNYTDQQGIVIGVDYKRYSARANMEVIASDKLKFGLNVTPTYSVSRDPGVEGKDNLAQKFITMVPVAEASAGVYTNYGDNDRYAWAGTSISPVGELQNRQQRTTNFRTLSTLFGEYEFIKGLRGRVSVNLDNTDSRAKSYIPNSRLIGGGATGTYSGYRRQAFVNENTLSYNKVIADKHDLAVLGGYSYNFFKTETDKLKSSGGFVNGAVTTLNGATNITGTADNGTSETQNVLQSVFGRVQYSFDGKYLFTASVRRDGSSRFGQERRWGIFPAGSVGWRISQESFMQGMPAISDLKLRGSFGMSGNNGIGDYSSIATLGIYNYTFGGTASTTGTLAAGQAPNASPNAQLRWEKSRTIDVGVDYGLFKNRIYGSFDYYTKTSQDLLLRLPVPSASGFESQLVNIGEVQNRGWEVELKTRNLNTGGFEWNTSLNFAHNQNEVKHLGPGDATIEIASPYGASSTLLMVGQPMYVFYAIKQTGILSQADMDSQVPIIQGQTVGDPKYLDANGDGVITDKDRVIIGQPNPKYTWGITNSFSYKGFDLSVLVQGQNGGQLYSLIGRAIDNSGMGVPQNVLGLQRDRWRSEENPGAGERGKAVTNFSPLKSDSWLYSTNYVRVRNITLGYNLGNLISKRVAQGARIYVSAENFFGHDTYRGGYNVDAVNSDTGGSGFSVGTDYGGLPLTKSMTLGLNVTF
ncbi:SusC/RagA family TonB-linked outer membrane protein [Solirubrum puertoriconensis]|uniref:SusC/RagA family TonB-linked outer membrane protein n=1 Tax=Solirubrum puertoriconensis TaxID=1751427 RepID=A0A9X0HNE7_SOLP1|nr:TonB-dependent receptor [Solirubrum puertoriconensis]KUG09135.1 SusC/RagA family TonB-linked outer membrane protein [Solirubrum puertoriconensis]